MTRFCSDILLPNSLLTTVVPFALNVEKAQSIRLILVDPCGTWILPRLLDPILSVKEKYSLSVGVASNVLVIVVTILQSEV